jgi:plastocyanin
MREWVVPPRPLARSWNRQAARLLAVLVLLLGGLLGMSAPASAAERVIKIDADGPDPVTLAGVRPGDTIAFQNVDSTFPHTVRSTSDNWSFDVSIDPGATYKVPDPLKASGRYTYGDNSLLEDYEGEVVVGSTATAKPTRKPTRSPTPRPSSSGSSSSPSPTPGSGQATTPPLIGGGVPTTGPTGSTTGPPPVAAPEPTGTPDPGLVALPDGVLPDPPSPREYGLPMTVAAVGAAGTASLLVRFLLAHPAGRRRPDGPMVTLDPAPEP